MPSKNTRKRLRKKRRIIKETHSIPVTNCASESLVNTTDSEKIPETNKLKNTTNSRSTISVHNLSDRIIPANSFVTIPVYIKAKPGSYIIRKKRLSSGLYIAECIVEVTTLCDRIVPIAIINPSDEDIYIREGTAISTCEKADFEEYSVLVADLEDELKTSLRNYMKESRVSKNAKSSNSNFRNSRIVEVE